MLSTALYVIGSLLLLLAALAAASGVFVILPQLLILGVLVLVGLAIERWRYKPVTSRTPDPSWRDTGERFVDPESGLMTAVYCDTQTGERHYLAV